MITLTDSSPEQIRAACQAAADAAPGWATAPIARRVTLLNALADALQSARDALVNGRWDAIGELLDGVPAVKDTAKKLPYLAAS